MARSFDSYDKWDFAQALLYDLEVLNRNNPGSTAKIQFVVRRLHAYERSLRFNDYKNGPITEVKHHKRYKVLDIEKARIEALPEVAE